MGTANQNDALVETRIQEVMGRLETDATLRQQVTQDLPGALKAAGIPDEAVRRFRLGQSDDTGEVSGYRYENRMICITDTSTGSQQCWWPDRINV